MSQPLRTAPATDGEPDELLVARVRAGERQAFDILYDRYLKRVYSFVQRRMGNPADSEELVQEVFLSAFSSLDSFRGESSFASWVLGIARRTVANRYKRKRARSVSLGSDPDVAQLETIGVETPETPLEHYEYLERIAQIDADVQSVLNGEQRQLFRLHHLEHRSIAEIATRLGKSQDAVKSNLYRTRKLLLSP